MDKPMKLDQLTMGVCYYPEQWDRSLWESDLARMRECGVQVIRIAEFAWNKFEPEEGRYTFDFFDDFLRLVHGSGIQVILGTPTATPPAWAAENYPEILNATRQGVLYRHGSRRHYNYNSPKYRALTQALVERLAGHYGQNEDVVGWQIDNELNCQLDEFYSEADTAAFRVFLQKKYGTLEKLNEAWGAVFWNQTYTDWNQVYVPRTTSEDSTNPHEVLDYVRFISDSLCRFAGLQSRILRAGISPRQFITTNGIFGNVDNHRLTRESLDFMMYDSYPNFAFALDADPRHSDDLNDRKWSRSLSEVRAVSSNFGIMEQQSGGGGWTTRMEAPMPKPGQMALWTMQSIAHGADYVGFFRWRTSVMGTEIYWHGILDYTGRDNRRLAELRQIHAGIEKLAGAAGAKYAASFAVLREYDNLWDARYDVFHSRVQRESAKGWFNASQLGHIPMDYLYILEDTGLAELRKYPLLVYPHATILKPGTAALLRAYVEQGGTLLFGCRTGYKDETGKCVTTHMTGEAAALCGADLSEYTFLGPDDEPNHIVWDGAALEAPVFNDVLEPIAPGVEVLGTFGSNYYKGRPGLTVNRLGKGRAYYFGGAFSAQTAAQLLRRLGVQSPFSEWLEAPACCELALREKEGGRYLFALNYAKEPVRLRLKRPLAELLSGAEAEGKFPLAAYGTAVFELE